MEKQRMLVWDLPTRLFHWTMAASFAGAFVTAESERYRDLHVLLGYTLLGLVAFRVLWGFVGTRYARFGSFAFGPRQVLRYLGSLLTRTPEHHIGHNPAGSWAIYALLGLGLAAGATGYATYNEIGGDWLEKLHEGAANLMLGVIAVHVTGVVASSLLHRENLPAAMLTGYKPGDPREGIRQRHRFVGILLAAAIAGFWLAGPDQLAAWWSAARQLAPGQS